MINDFIYYLSNVLYYVFCFLVLIIFRYYVWFDWKCKKNKWMYI